MSRLFDFIDGHQRSCEYRRAAVAGLTFECEHGRQVCQICDPCTCEKAELSLLPPVVMPFGTGDRGSGTMDGAEATNPWARRRH